MGYLRTGRKGGRFFTERSGKLMEVNRPSRSTGLIISYSGVPTTCSRNKIMPVIYCRPNVSHSSALHRQARPDLSSWVAGISGLTEKENSGGS